MLTQLEGFRIRGWINEVGFFSFIVFFSLEIKNFIFWYFCWKFHEFGYLGRSQNLIKLNSFSSLYCKWRSNWSGTGPEDRGLYCGQLWIANALVLHLLRGKGVLLVTLAMIMMVFMFILFSVALSSSLLAYRYSYYNLLCRLWRKFARKC